MPPAPRRSRALAHLLTVVGMLLILPSTASADPNSIELTFPQDPLATEFVDSFGAARSGGRSHQGSDLMAPKMTPVYAAADGTITLVGEGGTAGRWVIVDHGDDVETWYLHLNNDTPGTDDGSADWAYTLTPGIEEGAQVRAGQHIGWVGDSGNAEWTGSHTHFELHQDGRVLNPYPYLAPAHDDAVRKVLAVRDAIRRASIIR